MPDPIRIRQAAHEGGVAALEEVTAEMPRARRNLRLGVWAGRRLGLTEVPLAAFAAEVMVADHKEPGDGDVLWAVAKPLRQAGLAVPEDEIRAELLAAGRRAYAETLAHH
jgi:hypothetical protein